MFTSALLLIALESVLRTNASAGRVGQILEGVAGLVSSALSPAVPAIPDLTGAGGYVSRGGPLDNYLNKS